MKGIDQNTIWSTIIPSAILKAIRSKHIEKLFLFYCKLMI
jgi:hypothetical protein